MATIVHPLVISSQLHTRILPLVHFSFESPQESYCGVRHHQHLLLIKRYPLLHHELDTSFQEFTTGEHICFFTQNFNICSVQNLYSKVLQVGLQVSDQEYFRNLEDFDKLQTILRERQISLSYFITMYTRSGILMPYM